MVPIVIGLRPNQDYGASCAAPNDVTISLQRLWLMVGKHRKDKLARVYKIYRLPANMILVENASRSFMRCAFSFTVLCLLKSS